MDREYKYRIVEYENGEYEVNRRALYDDCWEYMGRYKTEKLARDRVDSLKPKRIIEV